MFITNDIKYVGVNDTKIDLFEGQYHVPNGMSYNSYVVIDSKIAVFDSVDASFTDEWLSNIEKALDGRTPDYLIVQHMEPDHSASILHFAKKYPDAVIVSNAKSFPMLKNFYGTDFAERRLAVSDGDTLSLGKHELCFVTAPMVHWPEVILTYDKAEKILFSADAFGKFGTYDADEEWTDEARRYYIGIVGKYGVQVQALFKKAAALDIQTICPLHGPVLKENIAYYIDKYNTWSTYVAEQEGVAICYTSVYGNTKKAVLMLEKLLVDSGKKVVVHDLARCDTAQAVSDVFKYSKTVLATTTYNANVFPFMRTFLTHLVERNFSNRFVGIIENGTWAAQAAKFMKKELENCKNITYAQNLVSIKSAMDETNIEQLKALAKELC